VPGARNGGVHDVLGEALSGEIAGGLRPGAPPHDDPIGTYELVLERRESMLDDVSLDAGELEVVPYECIACTAIREPRSTGLREATVVDEPGPSKRRERVDPIALRYPARGELRVDLRGASISMAQ
jgi:hypothetical protein